MRKYSEGEVYTCGYVDEKPMVVDHIYNFGKMAKLVIDKGTEEERAFIGIIDTEKRLMLSHIEREEIILKEVKTWES